MRPYNVSNDFILTPSAGGVGNKQYLAETHRYWPLASLQSAQSAAGALAVLRGSCSSRLCPRPLRRVRCGSRMQKPSITAGHRCCIIPSTRTTRSGLKSKPERRRASAFDRVHKPSWIGRPLWSPSPNMWRLRSLRTWECQKPSGLRPEGCCHSICSWLGVRLHGE